MEKHIPVLLDECIHALNIVPEGIYLDGTLGRAGHTLEIVKSLDGGRLIAIDQDEVAIKEARLKLGDFGQNVTLVRGNFRDIQNILKSLEISKVDGMLFDLGVSSPQLDEAYRGFSYMQDAPLDMRMDQNAPFTARELINTWSLERISEILKIYGEERFAYRIAKAIIAAREKREIETTLELVEIIKTAMPAAALREKQHPAKRSFQAIRIAVNDELGALEQLLEAAVDCLNEGGRIAIISFHSLEDRMVKNAFRKKENNCICPKDFPVCTCGFQPTLKVIKPAPIIASEAEIEQNPRARSAKLRVAQKI